MVVKFKMFLKEICEREFDWDEPLTGEVRRKWQSLVASLKGAPIFSVPRFYLQDFELDGASYSLCGFCDDA